MEIHYETYGIEHDCEKKKVYSVSNYIVLLAVHALSMSLCSQLWLYSQPAT